MPAAPQRPAASGLIQNAPTPPGVSVGQCLAMGEYAEPALAYEMEAPTHPDSSITKKLAVDRMVKLGCLGGLGWLLK